MIDREWERRLLRAARRRSAADGAEFVELIEKVAGKCSLDEARVLMKTFSNAPDDGTQELVVSALSGGDMCANIQAILEELPRLVGEAKEHAIDLVGQQVQFRPDTLRDVVRKMPDRIRGTVSALLRDEEFLDAIPTARGFRL